ncbi:MAG: SDR family NAD(P)-dependent oxidoreductase [Roseibium sp.]|nr:SDR family NAD(P)-dependent oxidoreductase [Roseibium sp.]
MSRPRLPTRLAALGPMALVTSASDGIGRAAAADLARLGFDLLLVARRGDALRELAEDLRMAHNVTVDVLAADLGTAAGVQDVTQAIAGRDIGVGVLAAGFGTSGGFTNADLAEETSMLDVNCRAVLVLSHELARAMAKKGRGQLVLFGSIVGFQGNGSTATYSATKAYIQSLAEGLARDLAPSGVHVLSVAPGPVHSGFAGRAGMTMGAAARPEAVSRGITAALGSSGTIRPGLLSKILGYNMATLPRFLRIRLMTRIMTCMAGKSGQTARPAAREANL